METITIPKRTREGSSFTPEQLQDAVDTLNALEDPREAVVVGTGFENENAARNRARLLGAALTERDGTLYSAHAVKTDDGTWIGAISIRKSQERREVAQRDDESPSLRDLQAAARYLKIKGRSTMDYDELAAAVSDENTPLSGWKGYAKDVAAAAMATA